MAVPFSLSGQGLHREGLVVSFAAPSGTWVGNFQRGDASLDEVLAHPDGQHVVVVAGGNAYVWISAPARSAAVPTTVHRCRVGTLA
jgi:hypothetical protein